MVNEKPWCVKSCPSGARVVGDKNDPNSEVSKLLTKYSSMVLKPEEGTQPNVYYIRKFKV
jgi:Fe-S-cluster-containing dehydrogenase component